MVATTGYDYNTISHSFTFTACASDGGTGGTNSGWQVGTSYSDTGLDPNKCYGYTVQTKDSLENTGTASSASETYSSANVPGQPTLGSATSTTLTLTNNENSNPASNPTTNFAVQVVTGDAGWITKWVNGSGEPVASEIWLTDAQLDALVLGSGGTPLTSNTTYGVKVKARNENGDETNLSTEGQGTTSAVAVISVSVADGIVQYGTVASQKDTLNLSDTQQAMNDGGATEKFNIRGQNTGCPWTLESAAGNEQYVHEVSTNSGSSWFALSASYETFYSGVAVSATKDFDLRITVPDTTACYGQQQVDVTVQAVQN